MRWRFAALALALLVPSGLLVHRAWSGVAAERSARQAALAERVFDEMERALSELVAREESRPVAHWRATWTPPGAAPGTRVPSPLAEAPEQPFVLGWFEIRPDGEIGTPHADVARAARVVAAVEQHLAAHASMPGAGIDFVDDSLGKAMMGTGELAQARERAQEIPPGMAPASEEAQASPAPRAEAADDLYSAFRSLNRGIEQRAGRTRKLLPASEPVAQIEAEAALDADAVASSVARRDPTARSSTELEGAARAEAEEQAAASSRLQAAKRSDARTRVARELAPADAPAVAGRVAARRRNAVAVDPLRGYAAPDGPLVLMRTLWHADGATRQGVVIDLDALAGWLRERAFGAEGFPGAELAIGPVWSPLEIPDGGALHRHAFAEPFGVLEAGLHLAPLPGGPGERGVLALAALLGLATGLGLFALWRSVAVTVRFAERRSRLAAAVAHELRTPLTSIRLYGDMLRDDLVADEATRREYLDTLGEEAERLTRLVDGVLELSRLERNRRPLELVVGDPGPVVEEAARRLRTHALAAGFALEVEVEPGLPAVRFDRDALVQVVSNLVDNALKYAAKGERRIQLACRRSGEGVVLAVRDRGPGVAPRELKRIFEPFERGPGAKGQTGAGIGLALVRGLAERMGAAVRGRNLDGGGFEVSLALASGDVP